MQEIQPITDFYMMNLGICVVSLFITILAMFLLWTGRKMDPSGTKYLSLMALLNLGVAISYVLVAYCDISPKTCNRYLLIAAVYGQFVLVYAVCFVLVLYLFYLVDKSGHKIDQLRKIAYYLFAMILAVPTINLFVPLMYDFDEYNVYFEKTPFMIHRTCDFIMLVIIIYMIWKYRSLLHLEEVVSSITMFLLIGFSAMVNVFCSNLDLTGFATSIAIFILVLYIEGGMVSRYMKDEKELLTVKTKLLLSQMRPHFLYNALSSISQLCKQDPHRAAVMTKHFSEYLSKNLADLVRSEPIPFEKEIEYIKSYLQIEQLRFGEDMKVYYNIETTDFVVPPMVIQPLLENSIKHGIGVREEGGSIYISSRICEDGHMITIADNGIGFDSNHTNAMENVEKRVHVGTDSVKKRLKKIPDARFVIRSTPGKGTIVMIVIPKKYSEKYLKEMEEIQKANAAHKKIQAV